MGTNGNTIQGYRPKNRKAEVLLCFLENKNQKNGLSYLDIARSTGNNNVHKRKRELEIDGIWFNDITVETKNKYGRPIKFKRFKLSSTVNDSMKIFNLINK